MRWKLRGGKLVWHSDAKYRIDWNRGAPSKGAQAVKDFIRRHFSNDLWMEEYRLPRCLLRVDFLNATRKFAIEFNGPQHEGFVKHFHRDRVGYAASFGRDLAKAEFLEGNGYKLVEIREDDLPLSVDFFVKAGVWCNK